jgi:1-acyl-sn-glycerol-3-phosphate acyltransferase
VRLELGFGSRVFVGTLMWILRLLFRIRVEGAEHVPDRGAAIIAANHVSALDGVVLGAVVWWRSRRAPRFLTAAEFFRNPVFGRVLRALGQIPIARGQGDAGALGRATAAASRGSAIGIFPEGRVNLSADGLLQPGRTGAARIALTTRAPIVPVGIWGTQERWPRDGLRSSRPFRTVVAVSFGAPVVLEGDATSFDDTQTATRVVMDAIERQVTIARELRAR